MLNCDILPEHIAILTLDHPVKPANIINAEFAGAFYKTLQMLKQHQQLQGIIITSAKTTFMAGGDLEYLYGLRHEPEAIFKEAQELKALFRLLETLGVPVVAAINGSALGGGYELALACHYRICLNDERIRIGLPEVSLGLLPGAGGVVKTVYLTGLQAALPLLMEGRKLKPKDALKQGLIHAIAENMEELMKQAVDWIKENRQARQPWDIAGTKIPGGDAKHPKVAQMLAVAPAMLTQKTFNNYPAPQAILNVAVEAATVDFETACRIESRCFTQLLNGQVAENMIQAFWFQLNAITRGSSRPAQFPQHKIRKAGILGAGMMGAGIAYVSAFAGIEVVLKDVNIETAAKGKDYTAKLLTKQVVQSKISPEQKDEILSRILPTDKAEDLKDCDLIIEAVFENRELKAAVTREAELQISPETVFASNTSTLPITGLAEQSSRPGQFIGLHFFSPVDKMQLVEIILGTQSSPETLAKAFDFVLQIKKTPIVVNDSRGFYTSRVFATYVMEGVTMLAEGQHPRRIESAGLQAGMPVAPLALLDEVSLSLVFDIREQTRKDIESAGLEYEKTSAYYLLEKMVRTLGRTGKKSGQGFYDYPVTGKKHLWPDLTAHFPTNSTPLPMEEMKERLLFVQSIETVRCLEENVVMNIADANIGSILGWGFAPFQGGTLQYINAYGIKKFTLRAKQFEARYGKRFTPPALLLQMAEKGEGFKQ
ncbi:MAG: enoyl-CoA hydratase/isomerase family protein [Sphingobacteriales bacterium]|nr:MAG: enoyl-CoA hydratase/isomerase family protein [Sphingobacteriales bacterium]